MRLRPLAGAVLLPVLLAVVLAGCADDPKPAKTDADASPKAAASAEPDEPGEPQATEADEPSESPAPDQPEWTAVPGSTDDTVTVSGEWTLTQRADVAVLDGPDKVTVKAPKDHRISHALIDGQYAVVVAEDELAEQPDTATVIDLESGSKTTLDGDSDVPTTTGGTWALGEGRLLHATVDRGSYCLAEVDPATGKGSVGWCAPRRHGFSDARITPDGVSLLTFDDAQPSCRTVVELTGDTVTPFEGPEECTGWDGLVLDGALVWSVVPKPRNVEEATFHAASGEGGDDIHDLGPGTTGSLTWCAGAAYYVEDPQRSKDPARLVRWTPEVGSTVVYETEARGRAFLSEPRCGGTDLTVSAFTAKGDEQVTAPLG